MNYNLNETLEWMVSVLGQVDNLTRDIIDSHGMFMNLTALSKKNFNELSEYEVLFTVKANPISLKPGFDNQIIMVTKNRLFFVNSSEWITLDNDITLEEFFQRSTIEDFGTLSYESIENCRKLITILGRVHANELESKTQPPS